MLLFGLVDISWSVEFSWTEFEEETFLGFSDILFTSLGLDEIVWFVSKLGLLLRFEESESESESELSFEPLFKIFEEWVDELLSTFVASEELDWLVADSELEVKLRLNDGEFILLIELLEASELVWFEDKKAPEVDISELSFVRLSEPDWLISKLSAVLVLDKTELELLFTEAKELLATSATLEKFDELVVDSKTEVELMFEGDKLILLFELVEASELVWFEDKKAPEVDISELSFVRLSEPDWLISKLSAVLVLDKTELELLFTEAKELLATSATLEKSDELVADSESEVELMFEGDKLILLFELVEASELVWSDTELLSVGFDDGKILVISELLFVSLILEELECSLSSLEDILEPNEDWFESFSLFELELIWFEEDKLFEFSES